MSDPRSGFNWRTTYVPVIDWSSLGRAAAQSKASSAHVDKQAHAGVNVNYIKGMGRNGLSVPSKKSKD
jgi:hypothetical protein